MENPATAQSVTQSQSKLKRARERALDIFVVNHGRKEYVLGSASTNTAESSFAILKRGIMGIYHSVSRKHLHRYVNEFDFRGNTRMMNDGDRTVLAVQGAQRKRLDYKTLTR
jgi:hypothetical protein